MGRRAAIGLHLALLLVGVILYVVFVLPRWWVLTGDIPASLATAGRLAAGIPIGLAALPILANLRQAVTPDDGVPELALRLRAWSAVLHVAAGALVLLPAIAEIWLRLDVGGPYLFAVYGAAGSIAILAVAAFYLSFVAEKPPAAPKPAKAKKAPKPKKPKAKKAKAEKKPRGKKKELPQGTAAADEPSGPESDLPQTDADDTEADAETESEPGDIETDADQAVEQTSPETSSDSEEKAVLSDGETAILSDGETAVPSDGGESGDAEDQAETPETETSDSELSEAPTAGGPARLGNKRPIGKTRHRLRR